MIPKTDNIMALLVDTSFSPECIPSFINRRRPFQPNGSLTAGRLHCLAEIFAGVVVSLKKLQYFI